MATPAKIRVHQFRARRREQDYRRFEVWVESGLLNDLCALARYRKVPLCELARETFQGTVTGYAGVLQVLKKYQVTRFS